MSLGLKNASLGLEKASAKLAMKGPSSGLAKIQASPSRKPRARDGADLGSEPIADGDPFA